MIQRKAIPTGRTCNHITCGNVCRREKVSPIKQKQPIKRSAPIARKSHIKKKRPQPKANAAQLKAFFDGMMRISEPKCENCGNSNPFLKEKYSEFLFKSCMAHLLPKRHFKSIATNPLNVMVLGSGVSGVCFCHDTYDASWEKAGKMNIFPEVIRRFKLLYPLIEHEEHQFIPEILLKEIL